MYQQKDSISTFQMLSDLFENVLNNFVHIKIGEPMNSPTKKTVNIQRTIETY